MSRNEIHPIELLSRQLDGRLSPERDRELRAHLAGCDSCLRHRARLQQIVAILDEPPAAASPLHFLDLLDRRLDEIDGRRAADSRPPHRLGSIIATSVLAATAAVVSVLLWPPGAGDAGRMLPPPVAAAAAVARDEPRTMLPVAAPAAAPAEHALQSPLLAWTIRPSRPADAAAGRILAIANATPGLRVVAQHPTTLDVVVETARLAELRFALWRIGAVETPPVRVEPGTPRVRLELRIAPSPAGRFVRPRDRLPG
jgi:hypothetical protein